MSLFLPPLDGAQQPQQSRFGVRATGSRGGKQAAASSPMRSPAARSRSQPGGDEGMLMDLATLMPESASNSHHHNRCLELLVAGHVAAFVELFDLTGRDPDKSNLAEDADKLGMLGLLLARRDNAVQAGERGKEHAALVDLAHNFEESGDLNTAKHFRQSTLAAAQNLRADEGGPEAVASAHEQLGLVLEKQDALDEAVEQLQAMRAGAVALDDGAGSAAPDAPSIAGRACGHLVRVKKKIADNLTDDGKQTEALKLVKEALALAEEGGHADEATNCWFRLGNLYEILGESTTAIENLERFMDLAKQRGDEKGQNRACSVLAKCYESLGDMERAAGYLERLIQTSSRAGQHRITSEAAARLGGLFTTLGDHVKSVHWHTQAFESGKRDGDLAWVTKCQIQLGAARAHAMVGGFNGCLIKNKMPDLVRLLMWKSNREESFTPTATLLGFEKPREDEPEKSPEPSRPASAPGDEEAEVQPELSMADLLAINKEKARKKAIEDQMINELEAQLGVDLDGDGDVNDRPVPDA